MRKKINDEKYRALLFTLSYFVKQIIGMLCYMFIINNMRYNAR